MTGKVLISFSTSLTDYKKDLNQEKVSTLLKKSNALNMTNAFFNEERREKSMFEWIEKLKLLTEAIALGSEEAKTMYLKAIENKRYTRDLADCMYDEEGLDLQMVIAFFWEQLAVVDAEERKLLINAYREGKIIMRNEEKAMFWEKF